MKLSKLINKKQACPLAFLLAVYGAENEGSIYRKFLNILY
jgi:hypothetical protein